MGVTRPSLQRTDQGSVVFFFYFSGMLANIRDVVPAIVPGNRFGFFGIEDPWLFFFAAMLFFLLAGSRHGCSIVGWDSLD
jgi:hypothetical protein